MAEIYLCDDEQVWIDRMEQAVSDFMVSSDWELKVVCRTPLPHELLERLSHNGTLGGIYFLDIDLKSDIDGINLGVEIRKQDPEAVLIFVTTHDELVMDTFRLKVQATDYILKDTGDLRSQICETLRAVEIRYSLSAEKAASPRIRFCTGGSYRYFRKDDIYFVESQTNQHRLSVHLKAESINLSCSLQDAAKQLGNDFISCRRGCLVNPLHIIEINRSTREITLENGARCRCSFRKLGRFLRNC